jgi:nitroreductase
MPEEIPNLFEIMGTTRSMRRLKPDPVPDALIRKILEMGVSAPSGGNMQRWRFLVIKDPKVKATVGAYYKRAGTKWSAPDIAQANPPLERAASALPGCSTRPNISPTTSMRPRCEPSRHGIVIYPAVQNMLLAARALGLGATLTTLYLSFEKEVEAALGLPSDVHSYALLPIGYPMGRFGPVRRIPLGEVIYEDRWGQPYRNQ